MARSTARRAFLLAAGGALGGAAAPAAGQVVGRRRREAALAHRLGRDPRKAGNGDEQDYGPGVACYSKALPHDRFGRVDPDAYSQLLRALESGRFEDFERVRIGRAVKLTNPQAGLALVLDGPDERALTAPPPPRLGSAEQASEAVELYWMALLRDVPFTDYDTHPLANAAAAELSGAPAFRGPRRDGKVTTATLFRDDTPGGLAGPFVSQFLWKDFRQGALLTAQRIRPYAAGIDYLVTYPRWLLVQNGDVAGSNRRDPARRYIRTGRDLAAYVHRDFTYQAFLNAALILLHEAGDSGRRSSLMDRGNPYYFSENQSGFCTFGESHIVDVVARAAHCALVPTWYEKWWRHRRLRPEELGGRIHLWRTGAMEFPLHRDLLHARALEEVQQRGGSFLLPQAYPEGSPTHPSYPAGHAAVAGACCTVLKAFFDEGLPVPEPVVPSADGTALRRYEGPDLTVGGELEKLAHNIATGRNLAGIHWRSDAHAGLRLGEAAALSILADMKECLNERRWSLSLKTFDGRRVTL